VRYQVIERIPEDRYLKVPKLDQISRLETPPNFRVPSQGSRSGAWRVYQDSIEFCPEGQRAGCVENHPRAARNVLQARPMQIAGNRTHSRFDGLRRFVPGRGAKVEKCLIWLEFEQGHDALRSYVLHPRASGSNATRHAIAPRYIGHF
jgi:hypothetical protein